MQTQTTDFFLNTIQGQQADAILRSCVHCGFCTATCPSGVQYGHLVDIGRELVDSKVQRAAFDQLKRYALRKLLPYPQRFAVLLKIGQWLKPVLPATLKQQIPESTVSLLNAGITGLPQTRKMLVLQGCVQSISAPNTNRAATSILQKLGIELITASKAGCCGAVSQHLSARQEALDLYVPILMPGGHI